MRPTPHRRPLPRRHAQEMRPSVRRTSALPEDIPTARAAHWLEKLREAEFAVHDMHLELSGYGWHGWGEQFIPQKALDHLDAAHRELKAFRANFWQSVGY